MEKKKTGIGIGKGSQYTYKTPMGLTKRILYSRREGGVVTAIVAGHFGYGKSAYCLKVAYQIYKELGYNVDEAWIKALDSIVFEPSEFGRKLKNLKKKAEIIILDDASVHVGSDLFRINPKKYTAYKQVLTTIRTKTHSILYNCPNPEELTKFVRKSDSYNIFITKVGDKYRRRATAWEWHRLQTKGGLRRIQVKRWMDNFSCYIPSQYYAIYLEKRKGYIKKPIKNLIREGEKDDK